MTEQIVFIILPAMYIIFGYDIRKTKPLNIYLEELYVLDWVVRFYQSGNMKESQKHPDYFLIVHTKLQADCGVLRYHSLRHIGKILSRLCGNTVDCVAGKQYPLSEVISVERGFRNSYYKINMDVIQKLQYKEESVGGPVLDDEFVALYGKIKELHDFRHDITRPTRVLLDSQQHIRNILDETYLMKMKWDTAWITQQNVSVLTGATEDVILAAIKEYAKAIAPGGWLSSEPPKPSLATFFYNPKTRKSFFITMLQKHKKIPIEGKAYTEFQQTIQPFAKEFKLDMGDIEYPMYDVYTYWMENFERLVEYQARGRKDYWITHFGTKPKWSVLLAMYTDYMRSRARVTKYDLGVDTKGWYGFVRYIYLNYNKLKIQFSKTFYKKLDEPIDESFEDE